MDELCASPIQTPQLMNLVICANSADGLNQMLSLCTGVKRQLELGVPKSGDWSVYRSWADDCSLDLEATNRFQHISGEPGFAYGLQVWLRPGTMPSSVSMWNGEGLNFQEHSSCSASHPLALCDELCVVLVHRLVIK